MKIFSKLYILNAVFFTGLGATPTWYHTLANDRANTYIGYGTASTEQKAKQNALVSISAQIYTKIDNEIVQDKRVEEGEYSKDTHIKSSQKTKANLSGYKILEMSYEDGKYFVAIRYENISSIDKFKNKLKAKNIQVKFDNYLQTFDLSRIDKKWYIKYQNILELLDKRDFERFFITIPNEKLSIKTNKRNNILYEDDQFYFKVDSKAKGYVSILTVYEDGTVATLLKNIAIEKNESQNIPDEEFEAIPIAGLLKKGVDTFDMYVAIYSPKKLIFDRFAAADEELIEDERYKNFDELLKFLDGKTYTTLKVVTKVR